MTITVTKPKKFSLNLGYFSRYPLYTAGIVLMLGIIVTQEVYSKWHWIHPEVSAQGAFHVETPDFSFTPLHYAALAMVLIAGLSVAITKHRDPFVNQFVRVFMPFIAILVSIIFLALTFNPSASLKSDSSHAAFTQWASDRYSIDLNGVDNRGLNILMKTKSDSATIMPTDTLGVLLKDQKVIQSIKDQDGGVYLIAGLGSELPITAK